jgi:hypothetical protein
VYRGRGGHQPRGAKQGHEQGLRQELNDPESCSASSATHNTMQGVSLQSSNVQAALPTAAGSEQRAVEERTVSTATPSKTDNGSPQPVATVDPKSTGSPTCGQGKPGDNDDDSISPSGLGQQLVVVSVANPQKTYDVKGSAVEVPQPCVPCDDKETCESGGIGGNDEDSTVPTETLSAEYPAEPSGSDQMSLSPAVDSPSLPESNSSHGREGDSLSHGQIPQFEYVRSVLPSGSPGPNYQASQSTSYHGVPPEHLPGQRTVYVCVSLSMTLIVGRT